MYKQTKRSIEKPELNFKISFFQDVFTIIEELTGDCPGVGLPTGFNAKKDYKLFKELQNKYSLTKLFITSFNKVKNLAEWDKIKKIIDRYNLFWKKQKYKLFETKNFLESKVNFDNYLEKLQRITKYNWDTNELTVFLVLGYKEAGTYDREINVIRLGIHEDKKDYLIYTLYHELIHYHIVNHMKLKLDENKEEILCRAIFNLMFKRDKIAQRHWQERLTKTEIKKINERSRQL